MAYCWPILIWAVLFWLNCNSYHPSIEVASWFHVVALRDSNWTGLMWHVVCLSFIVQEVKDLHTSGRRPAGVDSVGQLDLMNWIRRECVTSSDLIFSLKFQLPRSESVYVRSIPFRIWQTIRSNKYSRSISDPIGLGYAATLAMCCRWLSSLEDLTISAARKKRRWRWRPEAAAVLEGE